MKVIELSNPEVFKLIDRLCTQEVPLKTASFLSELRAEIAKNIDLYESSRMELLKKYGLKDDKGKLVLSEGNVQFANDEDQLAFSQEIQTIANQDFLKPTAKAMDLAPLKLSANDLMLFTSLVEIIS